MALTKEEIEAIPLGKPKHDGGGLWITKSAKQGVLSFTYRYSWKGRRPEMAIKAKTVTEARKIHKQLVGEVAAGNDPLEARQNAAALRGDENSFGAFARRYIENRKPKWKGEASHIIWTNSIFGTPEDAYASNRKQDGLPASFLNTPIADIQTREIVAALATDYKEKPIAADRLRVRIGAIIEAAREEGIFPADRFNPAKARNSFPAQPKKRKVKHLASLHYNDAPAVMADVQNKDVLSARALELAILTALRPTEAAGARWEEIDLDAGVWTVADERMKNEEPWRVPLSERAKAILRRQLEVRTNQFVFPSYGKTGHIMPGAMLRTLHKFCDPEEASTHGFRSTIVEYAVQVLRVERWLADMCLSHTQGSKVSRAYQRDDLVELRREIMDAWSDYLAGKEVKPLR